MMEDIMLDLKKYEKELADVSAKLVELDDQRNRLVRVGIRIEGVIAYIKNKITEYASRDKKPLPNDPQDPSQGTPQ